MQLNKSNFLRWDGEFDKMPAVNIAMPDTAIMQPKDDFIQSQVLFNDVSTYGINKNTIQILTQPYPTKPAEWDSYSQSIKFYAPKEFNTWNVPGFYTIQYKWADLAGNESNITTLTVQVVPRAIIWKGFPSSYSCELDGNGRRTGMGHFSQLVKAYSDGSGYVIPVILVDNNSGFPGYLPPAQDLTSCPRQADDKDLFITNMGSSATVDKVVLVKNGVDYVYELNLKGYERKTVKIEGGTYNFVKIYLSGSLQGYKLTTIVPYLGGGPDKDTATSAVMSLGPITFGDPVAGEIDIA